MRLKDYIFDVPDFPTKGILFRDITPLMNNGKAFSYACNKILKFARSKNVDVIVGPEARGFIFGCPVAYKLSIGFVPVRKPNKLPRETKCIDYALEYGTSSLHIHKDAIKNGDRVLFIDDLLATGGTTKASIDLIESLGGVVVGVAYLIELKALCGRKKIKDYDILSLVKY